MDSEVFLDTAYAIALANAKDQFHAKAVTIAKQLRIHKTKLVTTRAVLLEIGNALSGQRFRAAAVKLLDALEADPTVGIVAGIVAVKQTKPSGMVPHSLASLPNHDP